MKTLIQSTVIFAVISLVLVACVCPVLAAVRQLEPTPEAFYGYEEPGRSIAVGDVITAKDPQGVVCGEETVTTSWFPDRVHNSTFPARLHRCAVRLSRSPAPLPGSSPWPERLMRTRSIP